MHVDLIKYKCTVSLEYSEQCTDRDPRRGGRLGDVGAGSFLDGRKEPTEPEQKCIVYSLNTVQCYNRFRCILLF